MEPLYLEKKAMGASTEIKSQGLDLSREHLPQSMQERTSCGFGATCYFQIVGSLTDRLLSLGFAIDGQNDNLILPKGWTLGAEYSVDCDVSCTPGFELRQDFINPEGCTVAYHADAWAYSDPGIGGGPHSYGDKIVFLESK